MKNTKEKAAGVLDAPEAAYQKYDNAILLLKDADNNPLHSSMQGMTTRAARLGVCDDL